MECDVKSEPVDTEPQDAILVKNENAFHCEECQEEFTEEIVLSVHKSLHDPAKTCPVCNKQFRDKGMTMFFIHVNKHISSVLRCELCPEVFFARKDFSLHVSSKHQDPTDKKYQCDMCEKGFKTRKQLTVHTRVHTNERPYKCDLCDKAFKQASSLSTHKNTHADQKLLFDCHICGGFFATPSTVRRHIRNLHTKGKAITCNMCEDSFQFKEALTKHQREVHADILIMCQICPCFFVNCSNFRRHVRRMHGENKLSEQHAQEVRTKLRNQNKEKKETNKLPFCEICFGTFTETWGLKKHIRDVHYRDLPCRICSEVFPTKEALANHYKQGHSDCVVTCEMCDSIFTQKSSLGKHMKKVHKVYKTISCPEEYCKREFPNTNELKTHKQKCHSPDSQTKTCPLCGLAFPFNSKYYRHKQSHASFTCSLCGKKIEGKYGMEHEMEHLQMDREEYEESLSSGVFHCKLCDYVEGKGLFRIMKHLETHLKVFTKCDICEESYPYENCNQHKYFKHKEIYCELCETSFVGFTSYRRHKILKHPKSVKSRKHSFECSICNKKFKLKSELLRHYCMHNYVKCYTCEDCGATRVTLRFIRKHIQSSERCIKRNFFLRFVTREVYVNEILKTSVIYPLKYRCDLCEELFSSRQKLTLHIKRSHVKYVFKCKNCNAPFRIFWNWRKHVQMQICRKSEEDLEKQDLNDFNCTLCNATHDKLQDLTLHMEKHLLRGKAYLTVKQKRRYFTKKVKDDSRKCRICLEEFATARNMWNHKKRVHLYPNNKSNVKIEDVYIKESSLENEDIKIEEVTLEVEKSSEFIKKECVEVEDPSVIKGE